MQDLAGYGVARAVKGVFASAFNGRTFESDLVELMVEAGREGASANLFLKILFITIFLVFFTHDSRNDFGMIGKSNGKGYYIHEKGSKPKPDPTVLPIINESRRRANIMPNGKVSFVCYCIKFNGFHLFSTFTSIIV